jgi:hypothetical protein
VRLHQLHYTRLTLTTLDSIKDIAEADLGVVRSAIKDEKQTKALQSACKAILKRGGGAGVKREVPSSSGSSSSKRAKTSSDSNDLLPGLSQQEQLSPEELEASLALPINLDEELIGRTVLQTNRAPLVLAFAVELLRYTMPEQPPSSRLSLAQAVVSANSRSKAVSLGLEKGASAEDEGWGTGQPKVRVLGRDIAVLKRGGYEWKGEEEVGSNTADPPKPDSANPTPKAEGGEPKTHPFFLPQPRPEPAPSSPVWSASQPVSLKSSTFVGRATTITSPSHRQSLLTSLMASVPHLKTATHNAWAYRITDPRTGYVSESSEDDGETGAGALLLRVMRELSATDTLVVMTRWYGGIMLGPDRWRLMKNVVTGALAERLRKTGLEAAVGGEAVWGLDLEGMRGKGAGGGGQRQMAGSSVVGMHIHSPQGARAYLLKSFVSAPVGEDQEEAGSSPSKKKVVKRTQKEIDREKEENLGLLLGALRLLYDSWADHLSPADLDRRAWSWYVAVRPDVDVGPSGWGAKGLLKLDDILKLRRKETA